METEHTLSFIFFICGMMVIGYIMGDIHGYKQGYTHAKAGLPSMYKEGIRQREEFRKKYEVK